MLSGLARLGIEVESLADAGAFYEERLGLSPRRVTDRLRTYPVGDAELVCRAPGGDPRGGLHVHYAFEGAAGSLDAWRDRFAPLDPAEHDFGAFRSLYAFDPDRNCVEVAATPGEAPAGIDGVFEVVFEVRDLDRAERTYRALGFEPIDRGEDRRRVRLSGPVDLELWEPQRGLAGARGGVHVDLAFVTPDPASAAAAVDGLDRERVEGGVRVRDRDCHALTFLAPDAADARGDADDDGSDAPNR
ncbi:MAG: fosmidomycin resistance protein [Haloferacaceae archaeon]